MSDHEIPLSELLALRREKLDQLLELGVNPFAYEFDVSTNSETIKKTPHFIQENIDSAPRVSLAGRIMTRRIMGKAAFFNIQDEKDTIKIYMRRDDVGEENYNVVFKKLTDLGDIVGIKGYVFKTQTGETTIHAEHFELLTKAIRPIPIAKEVEVDGKKVVYDAFADKEMRYRQRYLDLIVNPHIRDVFAKRSLMVQTMRLFMMKEGYLEVETPILQPMYGGCFC